MAAPVLVHRDLGGVDPARSRSNQRDALLARTITLPDPAFHFRDRIGFLAVGVGTVLDDPDGSLRLAGSMDTRNGCRWDRDLCTPEAHIFHRGPKLTLMFRKCVA